MKISNICLFYIFRIKSYLICSERFLLRRIKEKVQNMENGFQTICFLMFRLYFENLDTAGNRGAINYYEI